MPTPRMCREKVRIIVHLDVDAFYVAAERELRKEWKGRPLCVSQYNPYGNLADVGVNDPARILYNGERGDAHAQKQHPNVNGSLIAVSYEARAKAIQRNDRGLVAIQKCPNDLVIVQVPVSYGKANLTMYRDASQRLLSRLVAHVQQAVNELSLGIVDGGDDESEASNAEGKILVEKASIDEVYLDLSKPIQALLEAIFTEKMRWKVLFDRLMKNNGELMATSVGGLENENGIATNRLSKEEIRKGSYLQVLEPSIPKDSDAAEQDWWLRGKGSSVKDSGWTIQEMSLAVGAWITLQARQSLTKEFDGVYTLSAGISTNKTMSKLASGLKKPNKQTLVNPGDELTLQKLFYPLPIGRLRGLGGKFGNSVAEALDIQTVGELAKIPLKNIQQTLGEEKAQWLHEMSRGLCHEPVKERIKSKRVGAGKTFRGVLSIREYGTLQKWIENLVAEVLERVSTDENRFPKTLTCWLHLENLSIGSRDESDKKSHRHSASLSTNIPRNISQAKCTELSLHLAKQIIGRSTQEEQAAFSVIGMEISASNFVSIDETQNTIKSAFRRQAQSQSSHRSESKSTKPAVVRPSSISKRDSAISAFASTATTEKPNDNKTGNATVALNKDSLTPSFVSNVDTSPVVADSTRIPFPKLDSVSGDNCAHTTEADADLQYAQRLQELFDKEHRVLQSVEERCSLSSARKRGNNKREMSSQQLISAFVKKSRK